MNLTVLKMLQSWTKPRSSAFIDYKFFYKGINGNPVESVHTKRVCLADFCQGPSTYVKKSGHFLTIKVPKVYGEKLKVFRAYDDLDFIMADKNTNAFALSLHGEFLDICSKVFEDVGMYFKVRENAKSVTFSFYFKEGDKMLSVGERIFYGTITRILYEGNYKLVPFLIRRLRKIRPDLSYFQMYQHSMLMLQTNYNDYYLNTNHSILSAVTVNIRLLELQLNVHPKLYTAKEFKSKFVGDGHGINSRYSDASRRNKFTASTKEVCKALKVPYKRKNEETHNQTVRLENILYKRRNEVINYILQNNETMLSPWRL